MRSLYGPLVVAGLLAQPLTAVGGEAPPGWYTQGDFEPVERVELVLRNPLDRAREMSPVIIRRDQLDVLPTGIYPPRCQRRISSLETRRFDL